MGHTIRHDMEAIGYRHPKCLVRDISQCQALRDMYESKCRQSSGNSSASPVVGLKKLSSALLGKSVPYVLMVVTS